MGHSKTCTSQFDPTCEHCTGISFSNGISEQCRAKDKYIRELLDKVDELETKAQGPQDEIMNIASINQQELF